MALTGSERFPKTARLRKRPQFLKLSRTGSKFQTAHFVVISKTNDAIESRLGITVSGKVGNWWCATGSSGKFASFFAATAPNSLRPPIF